MRFLENLREKSSEVVQTNPDLHLLFQNLPQSEYLRDRPDNYRFCILSDKTGKTLSLFTKKPYFDSPPGWNSKCQ